jgi:hypothetical protein
MTLASRQIIVVALTAIALTAAGHWFLLPRNKSVSTLTVKAVSAEHILAVKGRIRQRLQVDKHCLQLERSRRGRQLRHSW